MNAKFKSFLVISAKNALNAVLTNAALMTTFHDWGKLATKAGWAHVGWTTLAVVGAREASVWIPKLLAWSTSPTTEDVDSQSKTTSAGK